MLVVKKGGAGFNDGRNHGNGTYLYEVSEDNAAPATGKTIIYITKSTRFECVKVLIIIVFLVCFTTCSSGMKHVDTTPARPHNGGC